MYICVSLNVEKLIKKREVSVNNNNLIINALIIKKC